MNFFFKLHILMPIILFSFYSMASTAAIDKKKPHDWKWLVHEDMSMLTFSATESYGFDSVLIPEVPLFLNSSREMSGRINISWQSAPSFEELFSIALRDGSSTELKNNWRLNLTELSPMDSESFEYLLKVISDDVALWGPEFGVSVAVVEHPIAIKEFKSCAGCRSIVLNIPRRAPDDVFNIDRKLVGFGLRLVEFATDRNEKRSGEPTAPELKTSFGKKLLSVCARLLSH